MSGWQLPSAPFNSPSWMIFYGLPATNYFLKGNTYSKFTDEKISMKGEVNPITLYLNFGFGLEREYDWGTIQFTGGYNKGLNNFASNDFYVDGMRVFRDFETRLNGFGLNLGYLF